MKIRADYFAILSFILILFVWLINVSEPSASDWDMLTPLRTPILFENSKPTIGKFQIGYDEPHYIGFEMTNRCSSLVDSIKKLSLENVGSIYGQTLFDLSWRIFKNDEVRPIYSGKAKLIGIVGNIIEIGEFKGDKGANYRAELLIGEGFQKYKETQPILEIGVNHAVVSVGIAFSKSIYDMLKPFLNICLLISLLSLILSIVIYRINKSTT